MILGVFSVEAKKQLTGYIGTFAAQDAARGWIDLIEGKSCRRCAEHPSLLSESIASKAAEKVLRVGHLEPSEQDDAGGSTPTTFM